MAKGRRTSASRMLVELVEEGIELRKRKEAEFLNLAGRFRAATDPKDVERLGNEMGQMIFGEKSQRSGRGGICLRRFGST